MLLGEKNLLRPNKTSRYGVDNVPSARFTLLLASGCQAHDQTRWFMIAGQPKDCRRCRPIRHTVEQSGQSAWIEPQNLPSATRWRGRCWRFTRAFWNSREKFASEPKFRMARHPPNRLGYEVPLTWRKPYGISLTWQPWFGKTVRQSWQ